MQHAGLSTGEGKGQAAKTLNSSLLSSSRLATSVLILAVVLGIVALGAEPRPTRPVPNGPAGAWRLQFQDEFNGVAVNWAKWADHSSAEADRGRGNKGNEQLEWNTAANCSVSRGRLTITARPDIITSPSGTRYAWSSCLISSSPSFAFRYGYIEVRARMPAEAGFWSAFWTWQAPGSKRTIETDIFEYFSDNRRRLYVRQHSGLGGGCTFARLDFDPSSSFHTYGAEIKKSGGTVFYIDGRMVCQARGTSSGLTNLMLSTFVYAKIPPTPGSVGEMQVEYVRAWSPQ